MLNCICIILIHIQTKLFILGLYRLHLLGSMLIMGGVIRSIHKIVIKLDEYLVNLIGSNNTEVK